MLVLLLLLAACSLEAGCGAPGEPSARRRPVPAAVTDLAAQQVGRAIHLTFSWPSKTAAGKPLPSQPTVEILRRYAAAAGASAPASFATAQQLVLTYTIPADLAPDYLRTGRFAFSDHISPAEFAAHLGQNALYSVRTRISSRAPSEDSNIVLVRLEPVAEAISDLAAHVIPEGVELSWSAPQVASTGAAVPPIASYHLYRAESTPQSTRQTTNPEPTSNPAQTELQDANEPRQRQTASLQSSRAPAALGFNLLATVAWPSYRDITAEFGRNYIYAVRTVTQSDSVETESEDSNLAIVAPRDVFIPSPPEGLAVVPAPASPQGPAHMELSWSISADPSVAGYNVYRRESAGTTSVRLNSDLLPTPVFQDTSIPTGEEYVYSVTAVGKNGKESTPSQPATAALSPASQIPDARRP